VALAMIGAMSVTLVLARFVSVSIYAPNIVSMIGLGVAIDYSLFVVSRFREEIRARPAPEALARTVATAGRAILFSGLTVAIGLLGMLFLGLGNLGSIGWSGTIVVAPGRRPAAPGVPGRRRQPDRGRARRRPRLAARGRARRPDLLAQPLAGESSARPARRQLRRPPSLARPGDVPADRGAAARGTAAPARGRAAPHGGRARGHAGRHHQPACGHRRGARPRAGDPARASTVRRRGAGHRADRLRP